MSPEQITAPGEVDHRADIYALGVVFYQMLTGELPGKTITPPSSKVQIDVRLDEIVLRALEKNPELRYQQVSEVKTCVENIVATPDSSRRQGDESQTKAGLAPDNSANELAARLFWPAFLIGALVFITITGIACIYAGLLPKTYAATARIKINHVVPSGSVPVTFRSLEPASFFSEVQQDVLLIQSEEVLNPVISRLDLDERWGKKYAAGRSLKPSETLKLLNARVIAVPMHSAKLLSITSYDGSAVEAAELANAIADGYQAYCQHRLESYVEFKKNHPASAANPDYEIKDDDTIFRQIQMVDAARPPLAPVRPNKTLIIVSGVAIGFILGSATFICRLVWCYYRQRARLSGDEKKKPDRFWRWFAVTALGIIIAVPVFIMLVSGLFYAIAMREVQQANTQHVTAQNFSFGPVMETTIDMAKLGGYDLDTSRFNESSVEEMTSEPTATRWSQLHGNDLIVLKPDGTNTAQIGDLVFVDMKPTEVDELFWRKSTGELLNHPSFVAMLKATAEQAASPKSKAWWWSSRKPHDIYDTPTYLFKTREGGMGLLQITGFTENPRGVKLRYKLVQNATASAAALKPIPPEALAMFSESRDWWKSGAAGDPMLRRDATRAELEARTKRVVALLQGTVAQPLLDKLASLRQAQKQSSDNYDDAEVQRLMQEAGILEDQFQKLMEQAMAKPSPADLRKAKARLAELEVDFATNNPTVQGQPARINELERVTREEPNAPADVREAKAKLAELRSDFSEQNPAVQRELSRLNELERMTKEEPDAPADLREAKANLAELRVDYAEQNPHVQEALAKIKALEQK
jgi:uncharacterized protein involved in exopolysaccharide biosynthesis